MGKMVRFRLGEVAMPLRSMVDISQLSPVRPERNCDGDLAQKPLNSAVETISVVQLPISADAEKRLEAFVLTPLAKVLGHADRIQPLRTYCKGLLVPGGRKNIEQIAAMMAAPENLHSVHQSLHHFIATAAWDDDELLRRVHACVLRQIEAAHSSLDAWVVTDVGLVKKGKETVGITRKFCERQGRRVNCQSGVMVLASNEHIGLPLCLRLYLPESWVIEPTRRQKGGIPDSVEFATRPKIAIEQIQRAINLGLPPRLIIANEAYGSDISFQDAVTEMGLQYLLQVPSSTVVLASDTISAADCGANLLRISVKELAEMSVRTVEAVRIETLAADFASLRVFQESAPGSRSGSLQEKWLIVERPTNSVRSVRYWMSNLPASFTTRQLAGTTSRYWSGESAYFDLKDHLGLGHYEGRGWRGFHHHATLCIAVYGFLVAESVRTNQVKH